MREKPRRRLRSWLIPLGLIMAVYAGDHVLAMRAERGRQSPGAIVVAPEGGLTGILTGILTGHNAIEIQEAQLPGNEDFLRFNSLAQWDYPHTVSCLKKIARLSGKEVTVAGFMYPLESGATVRTFCLLRITQTCCYGPRPQLNQYILVEMEKPVSFERMFPVLVRGACFVAPKPDEGYIYRLNGEFLSTPHDKELDPLFNPEKSNAASTE
jgi:hypothetical protein